MAPVLVPLTVLLNAVGWVLGIELAGHLTATRLNVPPLQVLVGMRLVETVVLGYLLKSRGGLAGIDSAGWRHGIGRGLVWSAGIAVATCGGFLLCRLIDVNPLPMVRVALPSQALDRWLFLAVGGGIGPVAEELFFRGAVFGYLRRWGAWPAVFVSAAVFAGLHASATVPVTQLAGGLLFAAAREREQSILTPLVIHLTGNWALFALSFLFP